MTSGRMISFHENGRRFQLRAGGLAFFRDHVLLHRLKGETFWALPGGRVEMGEEATLAIEREFEEGLGTKGYCDDLIFVGENFFSHQGEPHHEIGKYFSIRLPKASSLLEVAVTHFGVEDHQRLEFKWFHRAELAKVDFRPLALRKMLAPGAALQRHFVQRAKNTA